MDKFVTSGTLDDTPYTFIWISEISALRRIVCGNRELYLHFVNHLVFVFLVERIKYSMSSWFKKILLKTSPFAFDKKFRIQNLEWNRIKILSIVSFRRIQGIAIWFDKRYLVVQPYSSCTVLIYLKVSGTNKSQNTTFAEC